MYIYIYKYAQECLRADLSPNVITCTIFNHIYIYIYIYIYAQERLRADLSPLCKQSHDLSKVIKRPPGPRSQLNFTMFIHILAVKQLCCHAV